MRKFDSKPLTWFKLPNQVRLKVAQGGLLSLGQSLLVRQIQPVGARPDGTLLWGFRRFMAAELVKRALLDVLITDEELDEMTVILMQLAENIHRQDLTYYDLWQACEELIRLNPSWLAKDLAEHLKLDPSTVTRILSPSRCIHEVRDALEKDEIGISVVYEISKHPLEKQAALFAAQQAGASRSTLVKAGKKKRGSAGQRNGVTRATFTLASGISFVVSGPGIGLKGVVDAASELQKQVKRCHDNNLDLKTAEMVIRDQSKRAAEGKAIEP